MSKRYLLAADVDKIQDFVFRSSRLQEVIGGSSLLSRFCEKGIIDLLGSTRFAYGTAGVNYGIVVNDGGSFRLWFDQDDKALQFKHHISEFYRRVTGGTITTLPKPVAYNGADPAQFCIANKQATELIKSAKVSDSDIRPVLQLPYTAICASCGVAPALEHKSYYQDESPNYLCADCAQKRSERVAFFVGPEDQDDEDPDFFLNKFKYAIRSQHESLSKTLLWIPADAVDAIGELDSRGYVAYLVADGNDMGDLFGKIPSEKQLAEFSGRLRNKIFAALANPMDALKTRTDEIAGPRKIKVRLRNEIKPMLLKNILPVVPLILGGDDIFVLLPAPYAVDFARCFVEAYEDAVSELIEELKLEENLPNPTLSAVIVICKSNYPYKLAHRRGEELLKSAKRMAKTCSSGPRSVIDVEVILSSERRSPSDSDDNGSRLYQSTQRPFWAKGDAGEAGIPIKALIDAREKLKKLAGKRVAQLKTLYLTDELPVDNDSLARWNDKLERLLRRIGRMEGAERDGQADKLKEALKFLGAPEGNEPGYWRRMRRHKDSFDGHALPDLLRMWDYCYDLEKPKSSYE